MDVHEIAKETYTYELERKDRIESAISLPINIIIGIAISSLFILNDMEKRSFDHKYPLYILLIFTIVLLILSAAIIVFGFIGQKTAYLDSPKTLREHREKLLSHFRDSGEDEFQKFLTDRYVQIATLNGDRNDRKSTRFFYAKLLLVASFLPFIGAAMLYIVSMIDWKAFNV